MKKVLLTLLASSAATFAAQAVVIDFESETTGGKANGYTTDDSSIVHFSDSDGANLSVSDFGIQSNGIGLGIFSDDSTSFLIMTFDVALNYLGLSFGNDQAFGGNVVQDAVLTVFSGATQVGQVSVAVNNDDIMNQSIFFSGASFDNATFAYVGANGQLATLIEIVDDIEIREAAAGVPDSGTTLLLIGMAMAPLAYLRRRLS